MKVAVLHNDVSGDSTLDEQDNLIQTQAVSHALRDLGHDTVSLPFTSHLKQNLTRLRQIHPDVVFNLVESLEGQGRFIHLAPAMLEALGLPYTGASATAMYGTSNKLVAKMILRDHGIPTPPWLDRKAWLAPGLVPEGPYIIKSVWEHASLGLDEDSVVHPATAEDLRGALARRLPRLGGTGFAEKFIEGREFNLSVLASDNGGEVLPPAEISFDAYPEDKIRVVGYRAKWQADTFEFHHTPRRFEFPPDDQPLLRRLTELALQCWDLFRLRGYARVDFRVDRAGRPWVLEINANPCLSPDAGFVAACRQAGLDYNQVVDRILRDAGRAEDRARGPGTNESNR
ncbi:MAG: D-alanine--D-alanine ligase [Candidatus Omnitrophica bacterium]|nr:D-alanine--D-alanine ligase [Candidatus Omnitrophota bacterium]